MKMRPACDALAANLQHQQGGNLGMTCPALVWPSENICDEAGECGAGVYGLLGKPSLGGLRRS